MDQMQSPDLVVVRAAHKELLLSDVLDLIHRASQPTRSNSSHNKVHAYIEYMPTATLKELLAQLLPETVLPSPIDTLLKDGKAYLWYDCNNMLCKWFQLVAKFNFMVHKEDNDSFVAGWVTAIL